MEWHEIRFSHGRIVFFLFSHLFNWYSAKRQLRLIKLRFIILNGEITLHVLKNSDERNLI
jgi:hypothetical protein